MLFLFTYLVAHFLLPCDLYLYLYKHSLYINIQSYTFLHILIFIYFYLLWFPSISRITEMATIPTMQFCLFFSYFCVGSLLHPKLSMLIMLVLLCLWNSHFYLQKKMLEPQFKIYNFLSSDLKKIALFEKALEDTCFSEWLSILFIH